MAFLCLSVVLPSVPTYCMTLHMVHKSIVKLHLGFHILIVMAHNMGTLWCMATDSDEIWATSMGENCQGEYLIQGPPRGRHKSPTFHYSTFASPDSKTPKPLKKTRAL